MDVAIRTQVENRSKLLSKVGVDSSYDDTLLMCTFFIDLIQLENLSYILLQISLAGSQDFGTRLGIVEELIHFLHIRDHN